MATPNGDCRISGNIADAIPGRLTDNRSEPNRPVEAASLEKGALLTRIRRATANRASGQSRISRFWSGKGSSNTEDGRSLFGLAVTNASNGVAAGPPSQRSTNGTVLPRTNVAAVPPRTTSRSFNLGRVG